ncbi:MAG: glycoside hydrolase family 99-like domain-containing protein [Paludibacteraceae bacterium]|nr:glycoside hydrolase family 99-like domain-containing protein [Paludibacteraceae bacterium]
MEINNNDGRAKVLAYYLPQFYPCDFNDKWYCKGFTEWTNVGKARSLFRGHYQPKVPSDLGYYDLRVPEVADKQAELARAAGVFGFAYWHYWWAGKMLLNMPAERMLKTQSPDFPFMFAWANESWYKKLWDKDASKDTLIMEQTYPGEEDNLAHFNYCLPFFKDPRYLTFDGRPMFLVYHPLDYPQVKEFMAQWNGLLKKNGVADSFYWMAISSNDDAEFEKLRNLGFDCVNFQIRSERIGDFTPDTRLSIKHIIRAYQYRRNSLLHRPDIIKYENVMKHIWVERYDSREDVAPVIIPNMDHTPRSGSNGFVYMNATPSNFEKLARRVLENVKKKRNKIVMMKSWNEWAEGNYMEPDMKYGHGFIDALGKVVEETKE